MAIKNDDGTAFYALDAPQKEGKDGYVGTYYSSTLNIDAIIRNPDFAANPMKIYYQFLKIVSTIQGEKKRKPIYEKQKQIAFDMEEEYKSKHKAVSIPPADKTHILIESCLKALGMVTDYYGAYVPLTSENRMGYCLSEDQKVIIEIEKDDDINYETP